MFRLSFLSGLRASAALAALLAFAPAHLDLTDSGWISADWNHAWADSGSGSGGDGGGDGDSEEDNDDKEEDQEEDPDEDGDNSGPGGGDDSGHHGGGDDGGSAVPDSGDENSGDDHQAFILNDGTRVEISSGGHDIVLMYANGWREEIKGGRYVLRDDRSRLVVERAATDDDYHRLQDLLDA